MVTNTPNVTGIVVDRQHKDGKTQDGKIWNRYGFQIAGPEGRHWYSSFDQAAWDALEKGSCYRVYYSEKPNPQGGAPFRNVEWWTEVDLDEPQQEQVNAAVTATGRNYDHSQDEFRRSKHEMRRAEAWRLAILATGPQTEEMSGADYTGYVRDWMQFFERDMADAGSSTEIAPEAPETDVQPLADPEPTQTTPEPDLAPDFDHCVIDGHNHAAFLPITGDPDNRKGHPTQVNGQLVWCYQPTEELPF